MVTNAIIISKTNCGNNVQILSYYKLINIPPLHSNVSHQVLPSEKSVWWTILYSHRECDIT